MNPEYIIVHHSLTEDGKTVSWNAIRKYHINIKKRHDIGYYYGIEDIGLSFEILKGRMDDEPGAHCLGFNDKSIGICVVGNYDKAPPPPEKLKLLRKLCRSLMNIYGIPVVNVLGHWETYEKMGQSPQKSCPGVLFSMPEFRKSL